MTTPDFSAAYEAHVGRVYGFFVYRAGGPAAAEDLTQMTFERAWRAWGRYDPQRASVSTWLLAIAHNLLVDHHRAGRGGRERPLDDDRVDTDTRLAHHDEPDLGLGPELQVALEVLSDREREILALRFGGDLDGAQIAEVTGLSLANVQQITSRSLRRLRAELSESGSVAERPDAGSAESTG